MRGSLRSIDRPRRVVLRRLWRWSPYCQTSSNGGSWNWLRNFLRRLSSSGCRSNLRRCLSRGRNLSLLFTLRGGIFSRHLHKGDAKGSKASNMMFQEHKEFGNTSVETEALEDWLRDRLVRDFCVPPKMRKSIRNVLPPTSKEESMVTKFYKFSFCFSRGFVGIQCASSSQGICQETRQARNSNASTNRQKGQCSIVLV